MREFFAAKRNIILVAVIAVFALMIIGFFLSSFGMCGTACNIGASACNPVSCVLDGCVDCTNCVGCMLGCE